MRVRFSEWSFVVVLLLIAAGFRVIGSTFAQPDPRFSRSDAAVNRLPMETPVHPDEYFFVAIPMEMVVRHILNPKFFENPDFLIYTNFIVYWLTGSGEGIDHADREGRNQRQYAPFPAYVIARTHSALGGVLAVAGAYAVARLIGGRRWGRFAALIAGLLTAVGFVMVQHAHYSTASSVAAGWTMLCLWSSFASLRTKSPRWWLFALAGIAAGLATGTRYNAAGVSIAVFLAGLILLYRQRARRTARVVLVGWALFPLTFLLTTPGILFDTEKFLRDFTRITTQFMSSGYGINAASVINPWRGLFYELDYLLVFNLGIPAALAALLGLCAAWTTRPSRQNFLRRNSTALFAALLLAHTLLYCLVPLRTVRPSHADQLLVPLLPAFAAFAGLGAAWLYERLPLAKRLLAPALTLALVVAPLAPTTQLVSLFAQDDTRYRMQTWVYDHVPRGVHVHLAGPYNVPLDPADYVTTQSYGGDYTTPDELRALGADYVIVSDAWLFDTRRSSAIFPLEAVQKVDDFYATYAALPRAAWIERPRWLGYDWFMQMAAYWHHPGLTLYCLSAAACAEIH